MRVSDRQKTTTMTTETSTRRCTGSTRFGIEAHDADAGDFPVQPRQKDGLGRMCHPHWRQYTNALRKAAVARKAEAGEAADPEPEPDVVDSVVEEPSEPEAQAPRRTGRAKVQPEPTDEVDAA